MTLIVRPYTRHPATGEIALREPPAPGDELAGFEACRRTLWGSPAARRLGLTLLPTLADEDLYVDAPELDALEREARLILAHLDDLSRATRYTDEFIEQRASNILHAIAVARGEPHGGVAIF